MSVNPNTKLTPPSLSTDVRRNRDTLSGAIVHDQFPVDIFADLNCTEVAAAHLGVDGEELKPIEFMNTGHYNSLKKANALSDTLVRRIEAFRQVAESDQ